MTARGAAQDFIPSALHGSGAGRAGPGTRAFEDGIPANQCIGTAGVGCAELVPLYGANGLVASAAQHSPENDQSHRAGLIQQGGPTDRHLDGGPGPQLVLGEERHSAAAHIDGVAGAGCHNSSALDQLVPQLAPYAEPVSRPAFSRCVFESHLRFNPSPSVLRAAHSGLKTRSSKVR